MVAIRTSNNPEMLIWARQQLGITTEEAADLLGVAVASLSLAETGERPLTLKQLRTAAEKFNCPYGYFYLASPPDKDTYVPVPDFRVAPEYTGRNNPRLNRLIGKIRNDREVYFELAESLNIPTPTFTTHGDIEEKEIGRLVRERLAISQSEISSLNYKEAYAFWKSKIESDGVLVYESRWIPEETGVIGIALSYDVFPIILIRRGAFSNERKLFSMLHEYAHLLLGISAINDDQSFTTFDVEESGAASVEARCNRIASELLIPSESVTESEFQGMNSEDMMVFIAEKYRVTYSTAAVCLRRLNIITQKDYDALIEKRKRVYAERKALDKQKNRQIRLPKEIIQKLDLGRPMFDVVLRAYSDGMLNVFDASKILDLRVSKIDKLSAG